LSEHQTLFELLERSGAAVSVYDVGRRIGRLERDRFIAFERTRSPYPLPMQRKAWCAFVQAVSTSDDPVIWFIRLDLDEQGLLVQTTRDAVLARLLESAQADAAGVDAQTTLQDIPCAFTPTATRMAQFHAQLSADLGRPASRFAAHAQAYFSGRLGWSQWEFVGYQGIADVACRPADTALADTIPHLPDQPLLALCHCLENQRLDEALRNALVRRLARELAADDPASARVAGLIRALAREVGSAAVDQRLQDVLDHRLARDIEVLAALSGKAWEALLNRSLLDRFLARLADNSHGQAAFEACLDDLLSVPTLSDPIRAALRDPLQPDHVRSAFGRMLQRAN
jgi:hypothetical protein